MPHLQIDTTATPTADEKRSAADAIAEGYADHMETGTGHVAVTIRERKPGELWLGRAVEGPIAVLNADVRRGRPFDRKRDFALAAMELLADEWGIPEPNLKAVFTEHEGNAFMGIERVGSSWSPDEAE